MQTGMLRVTRAQLTVFKGRMDIEVAEALSLLMMLGNSNLDDCCVGRGVRPPDKATPTTRELRVP